MSSVYTYSAVRNRVGTTPSFFEGIDPPTQSNIVGDLFLNYNKNKLYRWDGTQWVEVLNDGGAVSGFVKNADNTTPSIMEGDSSSIPPSGSEIGDLYLDYQAQMLLRWDGGAWTIVLTSAPAVNVNYFNYEDPSMNSDHVEILMPTPDTAAFATVTAKNLITARWMGNGWFLEYLPGIIRITNVNGPLGAIDFNVDVMYLV